MCHRFRSVLSVSIWGVIFICIAWFEVRQNFEHYIEMNDEVDLLDLRGMSLNEVNIIKINSKILAIF